MIEYVLVLYHNGLYRVIGTTQDRQTCLDWDAFLATYDYLGMCITATTL